MQFKSREYKITTLSDHKIEIRSRKVPLFERITISSENLPALHKLWKKRRSDFNDKCRTIIQLNEVTK